MHKKLLSIALALTMVFSLTACNFSSNMTKVAKPEDVVGILNEIESVGVKDVTATINVAGDTADSASLLPMMPTLFGRETDIFEDASGTGNLVTLRVVETSGDTRLVEGKLPELGDTEIKVIIDGNRTYMPLQMIFDIMPLTGGYSIQDVLTDDIMSQLQDKWIVQTGENALDDIDDVMNTIDVSAYKDEANSNMYDIQLNKANDSVTGKSTVYTMTLKTDALKDRISKLDETEQNLLSGKAVTVSTSISKYENTNSYMISEKVLIGSFDVTVNMTVKPSTETVELPNEEDALDEESLTELLTSLLTGELEDTGNTTGNLGDLGDLGDLDDTGDTGDTGNDTSVEPTDPVDTSNGYIGSLRVTNIDDTSSIGSTITVDVDGIDTLVSGTILSKYKSQGDLNDVVEVKDACSSYFDTIQSTLRSMGYFTDDTEVVSYASSSATLIAKNKLTGLDYNLYIGSYDYQTVSIEVDISESDVSLSEIADCAKEYTGVVISESDLKAIIDYAEQQGVARGIDGLGVYLHGSNGDKDIEIGYYCSEIYKNLTIERQV